jgi:hypothetical protein
MLPPYESLLQWLAAHLLFGFVLFIALAGIVVSLFGCNACVARFFGKAF